MDQDQLRRELQRQARHCAGLTFYRERFAAAGFDPEKLNSLEDLIQAPAVTRGDLTDAMIAHPPDGGFRPAGSARIHFTPSPRLGLMPVYFSDSDVRHHTRVIARAFRDAGVAEEDIVQIAFSYHLFSTGLLLHNACEEIGASVMPLGPGNTDVHARGIKEWGTGVLIANASFALKVAEEGGTPLRLFITGGEPFGVVEGLRERVRSAFGGQTTIVELYGLSEIGIVAAECACESGLHVQEDLCHVECLDPETGRPVPEGEAGELVITNLNRTGWPLFRFRTGDLAKLVRQSCRCGRSLTIPTGILGRIDNMVKVRGVKLYPSEVGRALRAIPGVNPIRYQVVIDSDGLNDLIHLRLEKPAALVETAQVKDKVSQVIGLSVNSIEFIEACELNEEPVLKDKRSKSRRELS